MQIGVTGMYGSEVSGSHGSSVFCGSAGASVGADFDLLNMQNLLTCTTTDRRKNKSKIDPL